MSHSILHFTRFAFKSQQKCSSVKNNGCFVSGLLKQSPKSVHYSPSQGPGAQTDSDGSHPAHGSGCQWVRLRGCPGPPPQLCVAQHLRELPSRGAGLHGSCGRPAGRCWAFQNISVHSPGISLPWLELGLPFSH